MPFPPIRIAVCPLAIAAALAVAAVPVAAVPVAADDRVPLPVDWAAIGRSEIDLSRFLDAPAGQGGFVQAEDGHFVDEGGRRVRVWGVNLGGPACFPTHEQADRMAAAMARIGIGVVRFHGLDSAWGRSAIDRSGDTTTSLDEENLERFDYLFDQLRRRGIYGNINLNVFRTYAPGDGLPTVDRLGYAKWATHFHPRLIELQERYARDLLTHTNRYTGRPYADEPAVFVVEIVNENSLVEGWMQGKLGGSDSGDGGTWTPLPTAYAATLREQFNAWLAENRSPDQIAAYRTAAGVAEGELLPLLHPDDFTTADPERFAADYAFVVGTERAFLDRMQRLIKGEVGLRSMLIGDADHNDSTNGYPHIANNAAFDYLDGHGYWQHPTLGSQTRTANTPMVNDPLDSTVVQFARTPMVGRPYVVSETSHPYPHRYAAEGLPIITAYSLLQDWDGLLFHEWGPGIATGQKAIGDRGWFNLSTNPMQVAGLITCAAMWHRADVRPAERLVVRPLTGERMRANMQLPPWEHRPFFDDDFPKAIPLMHRTRWELTEQPRPKDYPEVPDLDRIAADTGQLVWEGATSGHGRVTVDTPRTQMIVGHLRDWRGWNRPGISHLSTDLENRFGTVAVVSLDDEPIASSRRMLLMVGDRAADAGLSWEDDFETVAAWGEGPVSIRPMRGKVSLHGLGDHGRLTVRVLDAVGVDTGQTWTSWKDGDAWSIYVNQPAGLLAIIERE